ncbi:MAG: GNAT family N-acetyltransferase [Candidatus Thermoplasmatota archaeon]|nr:GNAT family N-acetyltransferase [Candidatus Thermoplasmatota archaeon]
MRAPEGMASVELMPLDNEVARAFLHCSPRGLKLSDKLAWKLSESLAETGYSKIIARDNRKSTLRNALSGRGWKADLAIAPHSGQKCHMVTTHDLPLDEELIDERGCAPELANTGHMVGLRVELGTRDAWAFYTDDGETARVVTDSERKLGMLVATSKEDIGLVADHLIRFLVIAKKKWAVFSPDLLEYIAHLYPANAVRMELEAPPQCEHSVEPLSKSNRGRVVALFSEYYDESRLSAMMRLRRYARDEAFSIHVTDGGFVILRHEGDEGLVFDIYVTPSKQEEGMGNELMRCALSTASERSSKVYLRTSYPRARTLYEKFGFRQTSSRLVVRLDEVLLTRAPSR